MKIEDLSKLKLGKTYYFIDKAWETVHKAQLVRAASFEAINGYQQPREYHFKTEDYYPKVHVSTQESWKYSPLFTTEKQAFDYLRQLDKERNKKALEAYKRRKEELEGHMKEVNAVIAELEKDV